MSVAREGSTTALAVNSASVTLSGHVVGAGSDRVLVVAVQSPDSVTHDSVTWNGSEALTKGYEPAVAQGFRVSVWYRIAPTVTTADVVVSLSAKSQCAAGASNLTGVHSTTPFINTATANAASGTPSVSVSGGSTDDMALDAVRRGASSTVGSGQTELFNVSGAGVHNLSSFEAGTHPITMDWTGGSAAWLSAALDLQAAAGGPSPISGTANVGASASGDLGGTGALAGSASVGAAGSAAIQATGELTGAASVGAVATGDLTAAKSQISGTASVGATASADLKGTGALQGAATAEAVGSALLVATGTLAGSASVGATATGDLAAAKSQIAGQVTVGAVATGDIVGRGALAGSSSVGAVASAAIQADGALSGAAAVGASASGVLGGVGALAGTAAVGATATGDLTAAGAGAISGTALVGAEAIGQLTGKGELAGVALVGATATGALSGVASGGAGAVFMGTNF